MTEISEIFEKNDSINLNPQSLTIFPRHTIRKLSFYSSSNLISDYRLKFSFLSKLYC